MATLDDLNNAVSGLETTVATATEDINNAISELVAQIGTEADTQPTIDRINAIGDSVAAVAQAAKTAAE